MMKKQDKELIDSEQCDNILIHDIKNQLLLIRNYCDKLIVTKNSYSFTPEETVFFANQIKKGSSKILRLLNQMTSDLKDSQL